MKLTAYETQLHNIFFPLSHSFNEISGFFSPLCALHHALDECWAKSESISSKRRDHITFSPNVYVNFTWCFFITYCVILSSVLLDKAWRHHHHLCLWTLGYRCKAKAATAGRGLAILLYRKRNSQSCFYTLTK